MAIFVMFSFNGSHVAVCGRGVEGEEENRGKESGVRKGVEGERT